MNNGDMPASPIFNREGFASRIENPGGSAHGLTKREMIAIHAPDVPTWFEEEFKASDLPAPPEFTDEEEHHIERYNQEDYGYAHYDLGQKLWGVYLSYGKKVQKMTKIQCYFAWRAYYADALLEELSK